MNIKQFETSKNAICDLVNQYKSIREFARVIDEDSSDVFRWKTGKSKIRIQAVLTICKLFHVEPQILRPDVFTPDVKLTFKKEK